MTVETGQPASEEGDHPPRLRSVLFAAFVALGLAAVIVWASNRPSAEQVVWSDEVFRDLITYCQAPTGLEPGGACASFIIELRHTGQCSVEATYRIIDESETFRALVEDVLIPAGDCLGYHEIGLIAYWSFDDQANPTADQANGHDATVFGAVFESIDIPAVPGNLAALRLNGIDEYAIAEDPKHLDGFSQLTLAAWVNPDGPQTSTSCCGMVVSKYASGGSVSYGLSMRGDEVELVHLGDEFTSSGVNLVPNEWVHLAATWDGSDVILYVNGIVVASGANVFSQIPDTNVPVNIGAAQAFASGNRSAFFGGMADEIYIFDTALTQHQIADLMAGDTP